MKKKIIWIPAIIIVFLILGDLFLNILFAFKKHDALGFGEVYAKNFITAVVPALGMAILIGLLTIWTVRPLKSVLDQRIYWSISILAALIGLMAGYGIGQIDSVRWLLFFNHAVFHKSDPIFHMDYSFYVYQLPVILSFLGKLVGITVYFLLIQVVVSALLYWANPSTLTADHSIRKILRLVSFLFLIGAVDHFLSRYTSLYTSQFGNFLYGPGYTKTHFTLPSIWVTSILILLVGVLLFAFSFRDKTIENFQVHRRYVSFTLGCLAALIVVSIAVALIGAGINRFYVHPNQASVEAPYIKRTINATRWGFNIDKIKKKKFNPSLKLTSQTIRQNKNVLSNVRINDIGQTKNIYNQLQSFKNYFTFVSADADRYNGQEVYVDARQLDTSKLPVQTWINRKLVYTHGYGLVASPVNEFNSNGLPITIAKDTPQKTQKPIPHITRPEIYFGTMMSDQVIAPSKQNEFDYPVGSADHTSHYKGGFGLPLKGNRLLLAFEERNLKYLTSNQFTGKSELLFDRNIHKRAKAIAPFLTYGSDVFPFVDNQGHIEWMMDAYTQTNKIPYAQNFGRVNYKRNSVKVVMDAYTGKMTFYVINQKDPMIQSLMAIYPGLFTTKVPNDVQDHFRYPKNLFELQTQAVTTYHMTNPTAFYNREDLWDQAKQIYQQNQKTVRPPVYQMIQMPDQNKPTFVLSQLFTPHGKMNLNGWLVAGNSRGQYGKLTLYEFPQNKLIFGPLQAENEIDSNPDISSKLTLWNQNGSHVVRGDLLLIPIGQTTLYVEPIYLVSNRNGSLPQLQRVIVDFNKKVYMGRSLTGALQKMVGGMAKSPGKNQKQNQKQQPNQGKNQKQQKPNPANQATLKQLAKKANQLLNDYKKQTANGHLTQAGKDLTEIQKIIEKMASLK